MHGDRCVYEGEIMIDLDVDLPDDLLRYIHDSVDSGSYASPSDVVTQALTLFIEQDARLNEVRRAWCDGHESGAAEVFDVTMLMQDAPQSDRSEVTAEEDARPVVMLRPQAVADLETVRGWLAATPEGQTVGSGLHDLGECFAWLRVDPTHLGCPGLGEDARYTVCGTWVVLYRTSEQAIEIVRILPDGQEFGQRLGWSL